MYVMAASQRFGGAISLRHQHRVDEPIEHALGRFSDEVRVLVWRFVPFAFEARDKPDELLAARAGLDQGAWRPFHHWTDRSLYRVHSGRVALRRAASTRAA
ncbi:MAG: hypothetical protein HYS05_18180 [Acidobacteria bacterium]|nr:hypothetical protein [Acidobacteriota bacterium]